MKKYLDASDLIAFHNSTKVFIVYESGSSKIENDICVSPRRKFKLSIAKGTDVLLVIYDKKRKQYIIEKIEGTDNIASMCKRYGVKLCLGPTEEWQYFKRLVDCSKDKNIMLLEKGFCTLDYLWMDCNVWTSHVYFKNGLELGDRSIDEIRYEQLDFKINDVFFDFFKRAIENGCTPEEYDDFKRKNIVNKEEFHELKNTRIRRCKER